MKRFLLAVSVLGLACQSKPAEESDAGADDASVEYRGETNNAALPQPDDVPQDEDWVEDAGEFVVDHRCCNVIFHLAATEPDDATGVVRASLNGLRDGLPLSRSDAGWAAGFCMPMNAVVAYHYEFTFAVDAGDLVDADGGAWFTTVQRASPDEFTTGDGQGGFTNVYSVATDCSAADASVGLLP